MTTSYEVEELREKRLIWSLIFVVALIVAMMVALPPYNVWRAEMSGKAEMAKAEQNRRIQVEEAKANLEAQKLNSEAEVERAKGMAEAIEIENGKLTARYIQYLWVRNMDDNINEKIYIPTEANLPILEAKE
jgi:uncharacterized membrane protein YqiK